MTTREDFINFTKKVLKNKTLIVALQRQPYTYSLNSGQLKLDKIAGGAHILLDGILKQTDGILVAISRGNGDKLVVDEKNRIRVPPKEKNYTMKLIFLKKKEIEGFYYGFANQTLWPLSHVVFVKPKFSEEWWNQYFVVNKKFAQAIIEELKSDNAFIWINDYHLALLPKMLKDKNPSITIGTFWHIPWPTYEIFRICPWKKEILEGLLGSDFIGFHRGYHVDNFVQSVQRELEVIVDSEPISIKYQNHTTKISNIPAGIDYFEIKEIAEKYKNVTKKIFRKNVGINSQYIIIGVDRIDYTKGIIERLKIIDRFFEKYPEFQEKASYLSLGAPSRIHIQEYKLLNREIFDLVEKINWKYSTNHWQPVYFINQILDRSKVFAYYKAADVCLVTSLDDGMNLVAKEYVICANKEKGMLVLSKFTGAAKDLKSAIQINPYNIEESADLLRLAITMPKDERLKRNKDMENAVKKNNIYDWAIKFIQKTTESF